MFRHLIFKISTQSPDDGKTIWRDQVWSLQNTQDKYPRLPWFSPSQCSFPASNQPWVCLQYEHLIVGDASFFSQTNKTLLSMQDWKTTVSRKIFTQQIDAGWCWIMTKYLIFNHNKEKEMGTYLAATAALEVQMLVCVSVCPSHLL